MRTLEVRVAEEADRGRFNAHIAQIGGDLLQSFEWGEIKGRTGWEPLRLMVWDKDQVRASISILQRELPLLKSPIFYAPRGPVMDFTDAAALDCLLHRVRELARERGAVMLKIDPPVPKFRGDVAAILSSRGFRHVDKGLAFDGVQPRFVMQLDLSPSEEEILAGMKGKTRYNIRYAERKGVRIKENCTRRDLAVFYQILLETAQRDNFTVRAYPYFELLWDHLVHRGMGKLFMASYQGEYLAGAFLFRLGPIAWYVYGASSNRHRNLMPNYLIQWAMIKWAKRQGCRIYDFRGVSGDLDPESPLYGLYRFKTGFGASLVEYLGEYDLPFRPGLYRLWRKSEPWHKSILKWKESLGSFLKRGD